jgi:hypothetical protein
MAYEVKLKNKKIDVERAAEALDEYVVAKTNVMVAVAIDGVAVTVYANSIMIKNVDERKAKEYANKIIKKLEDKGALY